MNTLWGYLSYMTRVLSKPFFYTHSLHKMKQTFSKPKAGELKFFKNPFLIYNGFFQFCGNRSID